MLDKPVDALKGVGDSVAKKLALLGVKTVQDLIDYYPRRYDDYSKITTISALKPGQEVSLQAKIKQIHGRYVRRGMHITEAVASDKTGSVRIVWFNQPYRASGTKSNQEYFISGKLELSRQKFAIMNPSMELVSSFPVNTARIVPIYRETKGLRSATIRRALAAIREEISKLPENLPKSIVKAQKLVSKSSATLNMHFPASPGELEEAKKRLGFEEVFALALASLLNKQVNTHDKGLKIDFDVKLARKFVSELPYMLTNAQRKTIWQIYQDMDGSQPMNRLVEGDVGSGKTVVAAMASVMVMSRKLQVALMAPTELLARQHAESLREMLVSLGMQDKVILLIGSMKPAQKKVALAKIKSHPDAFLVGTHALISEKVDFHKLGLIIIDEQHRFGVDQRKKLQKKAGHMPHVLSMTATPIPRTLALTLYGELDITVLDEMPKNRLPVLTEIVSPNSKKQVFEMVDKELANNRQVFVVCPLISESDGFKELSVEEVYKELSSKHFKHRKIGLLHGKMKSEEKEATMSRFANAELDILVSTTVIEVGVHVPNATVMMIFGVERFGLAQIHQLRGRVGRADQQGYCYLMMSDSGAPSRRIKALQQVNDGFKLAELDLELRGPGAIYGSYQHGALDLKVANLSDVKLIQSAREEAKKFLESSEKLSKYPELAKTVASNRSITNLN